MPHLLTLLSHNDAIKISQIGVIHLFVENVKRENEKNVFPFYLCERFFNHLLFIAKTDSDSGDMWNYGYKFTLPFESNSLIKSVIIKNGVTINRPANC